jgi:transposase
MANEQQRDWNNRGPLSGSIRGQRPRRLSPRQIDEVRQALADGARATDLAAQYEVSVWTIRRYR